MDAKLRARMLQEAWFDRDLSWLEFNRRVLSEALDDRTPLLERLKFLGIFTTNLDEFFMKRVGAMRTRAYASGSQAAVEAFNAHMVALRKALFPMLLEQADCFARLRPLLAGHGIRLADWEDLTGSQQREASDYFDSHVSPALTPLSLDPSHPFPFMSNLSLSWGFVLRDPVADERIHVRVKVPPTIQQWFPLRTDVPDREQCYVSLQDLVLRNAHKLFPGVTIEEATLFRVSRNADIAIEEDSDNSIRELIEEQVRQRRFQPVVRLEFRGTPQAEIRAGLADRFELRDSDVYELPGPLDYTTLFQIASLPMPQLRDTPWTPMVPLGLDPEADLFAAIRAGDVLVHHPYESFDATVERFIRDAADDLNTTTIKMTVYRLGDDTPFVRSLIKAAENGKQVACLVELTARFDEERNLHWANELQKAGDHVIYGMRGLKTHTKLALVVRTGGRGTSQLRTHRDRQLPREDGPHVHRLRPVHLRPDDHARRGYPVSPSHRLLPRSDLRAPAGRADQHARALHRAHRARSRRMRRRPSRPHRRQDQPARGPAGLRGVCARASQAGVPVDLIVRGFCCLRPGITGWTENVHVRSIIGRFLEHARVFHFANGQ